MYIVCVWCVFSVCCVESKGKGKGKGEGEAEGSRAEGRGRNGEGEESLCEGKVGGEGRKRGGWKEAG